VKVLSCQVVPDSRDCDFFCNFMELRLGKVGVSCFYLFVRLSMERVENIVGIYKNAFSSRHVHKLLVSNLDSKELGCIGTERDCLISKMHILMLAGSHFG